MQGGRGKANTEKKGRACVEKSGRLRNGELVVWKRMGDGDVAEGRKDTKEGGVSVCNGRLSFKIKFLGKLKHHKDISALIQPPAS